MDKCLAVDSLIKVKEHSAVQLDTILEGQVAEHVRRTALGVERQQHVQVSGVVHFPQKARVKQVGKIICPLSYGNRFFV